MKIRKFQSTYLYHLRTNRWHFVRKLVWRCANVFSVMFNRRPFCLSFTTKNMINTFRMWRVSIWHTVGTYRIANKSSFTDFPFSDNRRYHWRHCHCRWLRFLLTLTEHNNYFIQTAHFCSFRPHAKVNFSICANEFNENDDRRNVCAHASTVDERWIGTSE